ASTLIRRLTGLDFCKRPQVIVLVVHGDSTEPVQEVRHDVDLLACAGAAAGDIDADAMRTLAAEPIVNGFLRFGLELVVDTVGALDIERPAITARIEPLRRCRIPRGESVEVSLNFISTCADEHVDGSHLPPPALGGSGAMAAMSVAMSRWSA